MCKRLWISPTLVNSQFLLFFIWLTAERVNILHLRVCSASYEKHVPSLPSSCILPVICCSFRFICAGLSHFCHHSSSVDVNGAQVVSAVFIALRFSGLFKVFRSRCCCWNLYINCISSVSNTNWIPSTSTVLGWRKKFQTGSQCLYIKKSGI